MARKCSFYKDVLPILVIIGYDFSFVSLLTLFKAATVHGMNNHVFVVYTYVIGLTLLLPITFLNRRSRVVPPLSFSIISKIVLLGVIGSSSQIFGYAGISYSSPTLSSSIGNLVPAFTFILAVIFRMEKVAVKSRSSQAKVVGSIISIAGAFVMTFYKGPSIIKGQTNLSSPPHQPLSFLKSEDANWVIGSILLTAEYILVPVFSILQMYILKLFPDEVTVVFFYTVTATTVSALVALFAVPDTNDWKIGLDISFISIICSGIFQKVVGNVVGTWLMGLKGPVYVTSFKPLHIVIAAAMGVILLGDTLHVGSIVGAVITSIGLYGVLWGKVTEEIKEGDEVGSLESATTENVALLQNYGTETSVKKTEGNV